MKNKLTNIKKISDKQLKFSPKQIIFLTLEHIQLAQASFTLIGLKKYLSSLEIYNNWLPLTVQTILTQYLLIGESNLNFFEKYNPMYWSFQYLLNSLFGRSCKQQWNALNENHVICIYSN